jgi:hypothetical protein
MSGYRREVRGASRFGRYALALSLLAPSVAGCGSRVSDAGLSMQPCAGGCTAGELCFEGSCVTDCAAAGGLLCGTSCVDATSDDLNCGGCGRACAAGQFCFDAGCVQSCPPGLVECVGHSGATYCAGLGGDSANCGACGAACPVGQVCLDGGCESTSLLCPGAQSRCVLDGGATCADLQTDPTSCGACGAPCNAWQYCDGGHCEGPSSCPAGLQLCQSTTGAATCADLATDSDNCGHCGDSCGPLGACTAGACHCQGRFSPCQSASGFVCADLSSDPANCGGCNMPCVTCESCTASSCVAKPLLVAGTPFAFEILDAGQLPTAVAIGDFNHDGKNDLAVVGVTRADAIVSTSLEIAYGDGDGGFHGGTSYSAPGFFIYAVSSGDVNGDGLTDLVLATFGTTSLGLAGTGFIVLSGLSDGGFAAAGPFPAEASAASNDYYYPFPNGLVVADLNSDGIGDIAIASPNLGIDVFYGQFDGGFNKVNVFSALNTYPALSAGDLDGDGRTDLAFAEETFVPTPGVVLPSGVGVLLQTAGGLLAQPGPPASRGISPYQFECTPVIVGRLLISCELEYGLNADGGLDPLSGLSSTAMVTFGFDETGYAEADLNGDGIPDYLLASPQLLAVWLGHGSSPDAGFGASAVCNLGLPASTGQAIAVGDLNGDGRPDVAVVGGAYALQTTALLFNQCAP